MISVIFNPTDSTLSAVNTRISISPVYNPNSYSSSFITNKAVQEYIISSPVTVPLAPNTYNLYVETLDGSDRYLMYLPPTIDGQTVYAVNYITNWVTGSSQNNTASYAIQARFANTASYALNISPADSASYALTSSVTLQYPDITDIPASQSVGINQPNPQYTLDVNGTVNASQLNLGASSLSPIGGTLVVNAGNVQLNTFSGVDVVGRLYNSNGTLNLDNTVGSTANSYINSQGGKFGVGTSSPKNALDVVGNISASAISASVGIFPNSIGVGGITNPGHQIDINSGSSIGCSGDNSFFIGTNNAQTYFAKSNGNLGVGKFAGSNKLEVAGNISCSVITASLLGTASVSTTTLQYPDITDIALLHRVGINNPAPQYALDISGSIGNSNRNDYFIASNNQNSYINNNGGMVAIGYSSPSHTLDVFGDISSHGAVSNFASADYLLASGGTSYVNGNSGNFGVGTQSPSIKLDVNGAIGNSSTGEFQFSVGGLNSWINAQGGNVGIGTNNPNFPVDVPGAIGNSLDGTSVSNYINLNNGSGFLQMYAQYAVQVNTELDIGNGGYSDPSVGNAYDVKCGGPAGGITSLGAINTNGGYKISNAVFVDASSNVTASNIKFTGTLYQNSSVYVPPTSSVALTSSFGAGIPHIQAGRVALTNGTGSKVVFNKAFHDTNYIVTFNSSGSSGITGSYISGPLTTTGFTASFVSFTGTLMWQAVSIT